MAKIQVTVVHALQKPEAIARLKHFSGVLRAKYVAEGLHSVEETWNGDEMQFGMRARGLKLSGRVLVEWERVTVHSKLPFAALPFRGMIESRIKASLIEALETERPSSGVSE